MVVFKLYNISFIKTDIQFAKKCIKNTWNGIQKKNVSGKYHANYKSLSMQCFKTTLVCVYNVFINTIFMDNDIKFDLKEKEPVRMPACMQHSLSQKNIYALHLIMHLTAVITW